MSRAARILLVDDEPSIQRALGPLFRSHGYEIEPAMTGADAIKRASDWAPDVIVLDLGLPDINGAEVCRRVRSTSQVPIIILSARGADADKISALDLGADDYVTKPFNPEELLARVRAALRRVFSSQTQTSGSLAVGELTIDFDRRRVLRGDVELRLTPKEFQLLALLARNADQVLTHSAILKAIWGPSAIDHPEHLWVLVGQLRKKLETDPAHPRYVITEPWTGYRLNTAV